MFDLTDEASAGSSNQQDVNSPAVELVERFLGLLCTKSIDAASDLLADDVQYTNVGLPTAHGRERTRRLLSATLGARGAGFEVYTHSIAANGLTVLTERTDVLTYRRVRIQFWVCGRFDIRDGQIVLWRDYFSRLNVAVATLRGLLGVVIPPVRAKRPEG